MNSKFAFKMQTIVVSSHKHIVLACCEKGVRDIFLTKALESEWKEPPPHFLGSLKALKFLRAATADYFTQLSQHRGNEVMPPVSYVLCSPLLPFFSHSLKLCTTALWLSCRRESREATKGQCLSSQGRYRGNLSDWSIKYSLFASLFRAGWDLWHSTQHGRSPIPDPSPFNPQS